MVKLALHHHHKNVIKLLSHIYVIKESEPENEVEIKDKRIIEMCGEGI